MRRRADGCRVRQPAVRGEPATTAALWLGNMLALGAAATLLPGQRYRRWRGVLTMAHRVLAVLIGLPTSMQPRPESSTPAVLGSLALRSWTIFMVNSGMGFPLPMPLHAGKRT